MKRQILLGLSALIIIGTACAEVASGSSSDGKASACAQAKKNVPSDTTITSSCACDAPKVQKDYLGKDMEGEWVCYVDYERK